jgi:hypothetical protein
VRGNLKQPGYMPGFILPIADGKWAYQRAIPWNRGSKEEKQA